MNYPKIHLAQSIIEIFKAHNIQNIVISPGSRNAPLTIGFVNNPDFKCFSIADERSAGFVALGMAQQLQSPVALLCTSGSALLNYYPAFAEAFYSQVPLIVLSADRPKSKIDIGDGQTIRQENVFENHSLYNANLEESASEANDIMLQNAIFAAISQQGPVHINVPFEEPLYETTSILSVNPKIISKEILIEKLEDLTEFASIWNNCKKKLVLVGSNFPNSIDDIVTQFLGSQQSVFVMTESISNWHHESFINKIDTFITPFDDDDCANFQPEILLTFGGMIVSKRIKTFVRKYRPEHHWHIDLQRAYDVFGCLTKHFVSSPNDFFANFIPLLKNNNSDYFDFAQTIKQQRNLNHAKYLATIPFSDFKAFEIILERLPQSVNLQLANSSTIRYAQLFDIHSSIEVFCNRGTSGIDGATSTAIGAAMVVDKQTVFITGDISFFYDSNALWNDYIPNNFKVIVINNGGGGIFRILPGHEETEVFNTFFETSHCLTAEHLAKMYNFTYTIASTEISLKEQLESFYTDKNKAILEVFTPTKANDLILLDYFKNLK